MTRQQRYLYTSGFTAGAMLGMVAGFGLTAGALSYGACRFARAVHRNVEVQQKFEEITRDFDRD